MNTAAALEVGRLNRGKPLMVFDWDKAAEILRDRGAADASAGLRDDWEYTGGSILRGGQIPAREEEYTYLASTWAVPELEVGGERVACYRMSADAPGWGAKTYWPESARTIFAGGN